MTVQRKLGAGLEPWADLRLAAKFTNDIAIGITTPPHGLPERAQLWSEDWADRERAAAFVSEARRFHDESAARVAGILGDLQSSDDDDPAIQAMLASINQNDALAGDPLAEEAIRHLSLS